MGFLLVFGKDQNCRGPPRRSRKNAFAEDVGPTLIVRLSCSNLRRQRRVLLLQLLVLGLAPVVRALGDARGGKGKATLWD